jgi:hypothetical protein
MGYISITRNKRPASGLLRRQGQTMLTRLARRPALRMG